MRVMVRGLLVYQITASAFSLGWVVTVVGVPQLVMPFLGGVMADRMDRRRLLVAVQWMLATLWIVVALLILSGAIQIWHIVLSGIVSGVLQAFSRPASMALLPNTVARDDLTNAVALFAGVMSVAGVLGPSLGGLLVLWIGGADEQFGIGGVFLLTGLAIVVASFLVLMIRVPPRPAGASRGSMASNLAEGLRFVRSDSAIMGLILLGFASSLLVQPVTFFMPIFAGDEVLDVGASGLGLLLSARGIGAFIGALGVASFSGMRRKGRLLFGAVITNAVTLALFAQSPWFPASMALMAVTGAVSTIVMTMNQSLLQLATPDAMMGRVMSTRMMAMGFMSLGSLWIGAVAEMAGTPFAVAVGAAAYGVVALGLFTLVPRLRRTEEWDASLPGNVPAQGAGSE